MKFNHVTLFVSDFERSKTFYARLGLTVIVDAPPRYARFETDGDSGTVSIETSPGAPIGGGQILLYFECDDLDDRYRRLEHAGFVFEQRPTDMPYLWREARLKDPDGYEIRLYQAGENRRHPPWRFDVDESD
ncbi:VOC family protein [bacterium]|nr:VOC family protein [bacterium]